MGGKVKDILVKKGYLQTITKTITHFEIDRVTRTTIRISEGKCGPEFEGGFEMSLFYKWLQTLFRSR